MKRFKTLRARFAMSTAGVILVGLVAFGFYIYESMEHRLMTSVDQSLELVGSQVVSGLEFQAGTPVFSEPFSEEPENIDLRQRGFTVWVLSAEGETLASFGRFATTLPTVEDPPPGPMFSTVRLRGQNPIRHHVVAVPLDSGDAVVQVAVSLADMMGTLRDLRTTLWVAVPVLVILAGAAGYALAGRALAPIDRITRTARRISAHDLSARIGLSSTDDEVGRLAATFDAMLARIEASFLRERRFSADASHELRTPLSAIRAVLSTTLQRRRSADQYRRALIDLEQEAGRLERVASDLLLLARLDSSSPAPPEDVDLSSLLGDVSDSFRPAAARKGLDMVRHIPDGLQIHGRSDDLIRLFSNLIDNAVKFTDSGRIEVSARTTDEGGISVAVTDTGIGIPERDLPYVFDRFYRGDPSRSSGGAGLGLAIAAEIARSHGARLRATRADGRGTSIEVTFPDGPGSAAYP